MEDKKIIAYDIDGGQEITDALMELLNDCPLLADSEKMVFATLGEDGGLVMYATSGAAVQNEVHDVTDHISRECIYPFIVAYRVKGLNEGNKIAVKEFLDGIGKWLERQPITYNGQTFQLKEYPNLTDNRKLKEIKRTSPSYLESIGEDQSEDWVISLNAIYTHEFDLL